MKKYFVSTFFLVLFLFAFTAIGLCSEFDNNLTTEKVAKKPVFLIINNVKVTAVDMKNTKQTDKWFKLFKEDVEEFCNPIISEGYEKIYIQNYATKYPEEDIKSLLQQNNASCLLNIEMEPSQQASPILLFGNAGSTKIDMKSTLYDRNGGVIQTNNAIFKGNLLMYSIFEKKHSQFRNVIKDCMQDIKNKYNFSLVNKTTD